MHPDQPFTAAHSQRLVFATDAWRDCIARLDAGLGAREPFLLVTGEAGTGKSALVMDLTTRWESRATVAVLTNPALTRLELVEEIARRFGSEPPPGATKPQLLACLERSLTDVAAHSRVPVLVIEDAHQLDSELFDELRLLVNSEAQAQRALEVVLVGLPALDARLAEPALASLRQRVSVHCRLLPLSHKETRHYLHHRISATGGDGPGLFSRKTCSEIHDRSGGIPRVINTLAAEALRAAKAAGEHAVTPEHVRAAARAGVRPAASEPATATAPEVKKKRSAAPATPPRRVEPAVAVEPAPAAPPPRVEPAAAVAAEPASEPVPAPAEPVAAAEPTPARVEPVAAAAPPPAEPARDERVSAWVSRFVGEGPPRIGAALVTAEYLEFDADEAPVTAPFESSASPVERGDEDPESSSRKPLRLIVLDDLPEEIPPARAPLPPVRHAPRGRAAGTAVAAGVFALAAVATVLVLSRGRMLRHELAADNASSVESPDSVTRALVATTIASRASVSPRPSGAASSAPTQSSAPVVQAVRARTTVAPWAQPTASPASTVDAGAPATSASPRSRLTLEVGTYLDPERAHFELDRLTEQSGLRGWVVSRSEFGSPSYRVLLGAFSSDERATASANMLLERGLIGEAQVVPLPSRRARR